MVSDSLKTKKLLEEIPMYYLMTSQPMIDMYIEHIREDVVHYECEDEEKEKENRISDFKKMMSKRGIAILKELFSDSYLNKSPFDNEKLAEFAMRFSDSDNTMDRLYWLQEIVSYTMYITMLYVFCDKEPQPVSNSIDDTPDISSSTSSDYTFGTWKEALEWATERFEMAKNGNLFKQNSSANSNRKAISLSSALKDLKSEENWTPAVASAFAKVGVTDPSELTPAKFLSLLAKNRKKDKETGKDIIGIWGERKVKDYEGSYIRNPNGTYKTEPVLRKVGSWTKHTLMRVLEQNGIVISL